MAKGKYVAIKRIWLGKEKQYIEPGEAVDKSRLSQEAFTTLLGQGVIGEEGQSDPQEEINQEEVNDD